MKNFRVKFIGTLLIVAVIVLSFASYGIFKFSNIMTKMYPMFLNMKYPMLFLCESIVVVLIFAILFGIFALKKYGDGKVFGREMLFDLQVIALSFIGICLISILCIIYTDFNLDGSITNLIFIGISILSMLIAQIFLLLSDLIKEGIDLKVENDLTI
ncbi:MULTISPECIES: DUF2975 domain-containing protein [Peptoniphilus]|uniref:DUF2975 domain-containing protein n=1 Tax=Peptoniphilus TaxID=162289 RepID=UPI000287F315|nr:MULTISPECIES: DUF2975 domain-containing protein [Peptoniphilus]MBS6611070.1 DUF2975 domain-containing protein [Peptoniphilus harei]MDU1955447.1 DUF2975 domain-containing protein [Peptoniphilus lacydonensis]MDU2109272.1 DUF2975 domain-containing protein [Peptoniphilus lacydonensis]MDU3751681.1 DUF2975 domain-containing protein [Peptoniphilus rhinitidis]MDU5275952.1 DUF2975 domain-containing protein [Peptoniphilus lacydonensis]